MHSRPDLVVSTLLEDVQRNGFCFATADTIRPLLESPLLKSPLLELPPQNSPGDLSD